MPRRSAIHTILPAAAIFATLAACTTPAAAGTEPGFAPGRAVFGSCPAKPVYPAEALRDKRAGAVQLAFLVDADDTLLDSKIKQSSGHADLDEAARVGLAKCKFKAATQDGKPVREWVELRYNWQP